MPADVRINDVTTNVNLVDSAGMLTPEALERIVMAVMRRLEEKHRADQEIAEERSIGAMRQGKGNQ